MIFLSFEFVICLLSFNFVLIRKNDCMKNLVLFSIILFLAACGAPSSPIISDCDGDLSKFKIADVKSSDFQTATYINPAGQLIEDGFLKDGCKTGAWTSYYPEDGKIKTITNYLGGVLFGPSIQYSNRGQMEKLTNYLNGQLHGKYMEFNYGKMAKEIDYKHDVVNGFIKEYTRTGKLQKETHYKDGQLNGTLKHYNDEGKVVMEYVYKKGKKVSGGIVE